MVLENPAASPQMPPDIAVEHLLAGQQKSQGSHQERQNFIGEGAGAARIT